MIKWGIIGLGRIAHKFAQNLQHVDGTQLLAVASRNKAKAGEFASNHGALQHYGSYQELMSNPDVDIVYIATPHDSHAELSIAAMRAGKHVLCEKPLAVNSMQVQTMIDAARENKVFLMEAFWSRFNPAIRDILAIIEDGKIGNVNYVQADFTFSRNDPDESRLLNMQLAGGALLDMGVYPVFLAYMVFGIPDEIHATSRFHATGADLQTAAILKYKNGIAQLMTGFRSQSDMTAKICGTDGTILIDPTWHHPEGYQMFKPNKEKEALHYSFPTEGKGFAFEIEECVRCLQEGKIESSLWSHRNSLELINIVDKIRAKIGLKYPFE